MAAIVHDTPVVAVGPWAPVGQLTIRLTAGGKTFSQQLTLKPDPRVKMSRAGFDRQFEIAYWCWSTMREVSKTLSDIRAFRKQLKAGDPREAEAAALEGAGGGGRRRPAAGTGFGGLLGTLTGLMDSVDAADMEPTIQMISQYQSSKIDFQALMKLWSALKAKRI